MFYQQLATFKLRPLCYWHEEIITDIAAPANSLDDQQDMVDDE
jgi:hypothetical protein